MRSRECQKRVCRCCCRSCRRRSVLSSMGVVLVLRISNTFPTVSLLFISARKKKKQIFGISQNDESNNKILRTDGVTSVFARYLVLAANATLAGRIPFSVFTCGRENAAAGVFLSPKLPPFLLLFYTYIYISMAIREETFQMPVNYLLFWLSKK